MWNYRTVIFFILFVSACSNTVADPTLDRTTLPAIGRQETILTITDFGRYAIMAKSEQGTEVQYIDRMAGPSAINGIAGSVNGRLDVFLDRGTYKIITYSHAEGEGDVTLTVKKFTELHKHAPRLIDYKLIESTLDDFQQRSFWLNIEQRRTVIIEAAGRNLSDMRLWKDGNWLLDIQPTQLAVEPHAGQPVVVNRIVADLQPGLYLLSQYGGPQQDWAETSNEHPLFIRMGIPEIAEASRERKVTSPFGYDRWLVPASADYFRLEIPKAEKASILVNLYNEKDPFSEYGVRKSIDKKSRIPVAEIYSYSQSNLKIVTINYEAGKPYIFQRFKAAKSVRLVHSGTYWVSTLHSGFGADSVDATGILTRGRYRSEVLVEHRSIVINEDIGWTRRFNLLETLTLHFEVKSRGRYRVSGKGVNAEFRFEPFLTSRPKNYRAPQFKPLGSNWSLDPGFYVLTVKNKYEDKGIGTLSVNHSDNKKVKPNTAQTALRFPKVRVSGRDHYTVYLNHQPGVKTGLIVREIPIDLSTTLPVVQEPNKPLRIPVHIPKTGELVAISEAGALLKISIDNGQQKNRHRLTSGNYQVKIESDEKENLHYQLRFTEEKFLANVPLPPISKAALDKIPNFAKLTSVKPHFFDVDRTEQKTFRVSVSEPDLYRLETTGLLQTQGNIRTRTQTSLDRKSNNGVGRNFLIQQYLREGEYQLSVQPEGETRGHLGLQLVQTKLQHNGILLDGIPARYTLASGQGLIYEFTIAKRGLYRLRSFGLEKEFLVRLEDGDGWPLLKPGITGNIHRVFHPGKYRLVVLPMALESKVTSILQADTIEIKRQGHGPFELPFNKRLQHVWLEPKEGKTRPRDQWQFELPATVNTTINLSQDMEGSLYRLDGKADEKLIDKMPTSVFEKMLPAGRYSLKIKSRRKNNRLDYHLSIFLKEMIKGETRSVQAPASIPISIGAPGLVEVSSFGNKDIKAYLYDDRNRLLAVNDDRPHSWDFNVTQKLFPGKYTLKIFPVGNSYSATAITVRAPADVHEKTLKLPGTLSVSDERVHNYPLSFKPGIGVLAVAAASRDTVGMAIEKKIGQDWIAIATQVGTNPLLSIALPKNQAKYRLKVWGPERRKAPIKVSAQRVETRIYSEGDLRSGIRLKPVKLLTHKVSAALIKLARPGVFTPKSNKGLFWSASANAKLTMHNQEIVSSNSTRIWLLMDASTSRPSAQRIKLSNQKQSLVIPKDSVMWLDSKSKGSTIELALAESRVGQPGIMFNSKHSPFSMGVDHNSAISLDNSNSASTIKVWNADSDSVELPVYISRWSFKEVKQKKITHGIHAKRLAASSATRYPLPEGLKGIKFSLPRKVAASLIKDNRFIKTFWSAHADTTYLIDSDADSILFINTSGSSKAMSLTLFNKDNNNLLSLSEGGMIKRYFAEAGVLNIKVKPEHHTPGTLAILDLYGNDVSIVSVEKSGKIGKRYPLNVSEETDIQIRHGAGLMVAWLNTSTVGSSVFEGDEASLSAMINLYGRSKILKFDNPKPVIVHLHAAQPMITRLKIPGLTEKIQIFEQGMNLNLLLPKGPSAIVVENVSSEPLSGTLHINTTAITKLSEGLGARISLSPGEAKMYQFNVSKKITVGLGVKASIDVANCLLFNEQGKEIGFGVSQMHSLDKGVYYMMVQSPNSGPTVTIQPALVGLAAPSTGPSTKIMQEYQTLIAPNAL